MSDTLLDELRRLPLKQQDGTVPASFRGDAYHDWWAGWEVALESVNVPALIARIEADGAQLAAVTLERDAARSAEKVQTERVAEFRRQRDAAEAAHREYRRERVNAVVNTFWELFPSYAWTDEATAIDLMRAEVLATRRERDRLREAADLALSLQGTARYDEGMTALSNALAQPTTEKP